MGEEAYFIVNAKTFVEVLTTLSSIIHPKEGELVKKQVLVEVSDNKVTLKTINESTLLVAKIDAQNTANGKFCVTASYLINLLSRFNGDVTVFEEENKLHIKSGRSKYQTSLFPIDEFEELCAVDEIELQTDRIKVDLEPFRSALECVYSSASKEDLTLSSTYVAHNHDTDKDCIVCSNSELGAAVIKDSIVSFPQGPIPKFIVDFILKLKDLRVLEFVVNDGLFMGTAGCYTFYYRSPDIDYPWDEINGFLEAYPTLTKRFRFFKNDMIAALARITVIADNATHAVTLKFTGDLVVIESEGPGHKGSETISLIESANDGEAYEISMDSVYLMNVLKEFEGNVDYYCSDSEAPQFVTDGFLVKFFMGLAD